MPARDTAPVGAPCWVDLMTSDRARSVDFYTALFGWEAEEPNEEFGGYLNFTLDGVRIAGCMAAPQEDVPDVWSVYLAVEDATTTVEAAGADGGQVMVGAMPVGGLGTMAVVVDAGGAAIGLWQPGEHTGFGILGEPGAPSWFELYARDYERSVTFYRDVFGWTTHVVEDQPDFRYTTLAQGDEWLAGIMDASAILPDGAPPHWGVYFGSDDTDATVGRAVELGGAVVLEPEDSPYGRLATLTDPTGAVFKLVEDTRPPAPAS